VKLRVPHKGLAELHPADLRRVIDQLSRNDRVGLIASLDDEARGGCPSVRWNPRPRSTSWKIWSRRARPNPRGDDPDEAADLVARSVDESREEILGLMRRTRRRKSRSS